MRRRDILLVVLFTTGALTMVATSEVDAGQDKKGEKFPEKVTYRKWVVQGVGGKDKFFLPDVKDRPALFREAKGISMWHLSSGGLPHKTPTPGSEIVAADGTTWVVEKVAEGGDNYVLTCKKKEEPKKE